MNLKNLYWWADEEGGAEDLFLYHGVNLDEFDLSPYERSQIESMVDHYRAANAIWDVLTWDVLTENIDSEEPDYD